MKMTGLNAVVFKTNWGWAGASIGTRGVASFQLPVARQKQAVEKLSLEFAQPAGAIKKLAGVDKAYEIIFDAEPLAASTSRRLQLVSSLVEQVVAYFDGSNLRLQIAMELPTSTEFRRRVWKELLEIKAGEWIAYGELAARANRPHAARAVGGAMAANRLPLLIPCHRVLASNGRLTGYSAEGGLGIKQRLLEHEARYSKSASDKKTQQSLRNLAWSAQARLAL